MRSRRIQYMSGNVASSTNVYVTYTIEHHIRPLVIVAPIGCDGRGHSNAHVE